MKRTASLLLLLLAAACNGPAHPPEENSPQAASSTTPPSAVRFEDVTRAAGIGFVHSHGGTGEKYMIETLGSGVCLLDFDSDGWPDIYFVQSGAIPTDPPRTGPTGSMLYRNRGDATFEDVTARAGVGGVGYGMGCTVADVENDGDEDLYVTAFGRNTLYRNNGNGTFTDVTQDAGVGDARWGSSAAFGDYDNDSLPDLFVVNYVDFTLGNNVYCGDLKPGYRTYCHPQTFSGLPDVLYHNEGGGRFRDVTKQAGLYDPSGKGLGVVWGDFDSDGWQDLYVANDSTPNFLYHNNGNGTFVEMGQVAGVALGEEGIPRAGMGVAAGDCDEDGREDLFVTNLSQEPNSLFRNLGDNLFADETYPSGLGSPSLLALGFGTNFLDADLDSRLDIFVTNGHILDNVELYSDSITYRQTPFLFENLGGCRFRDVSSTSGPYFLSRDVGRGTAVGDLNHDGAPDLLISANNLPAHLLLNRTPRSSRHWIALRLLGRHGSDALGARVEVVAGGRSLWTQARSASSYLSQSDSVIELGLGEADRVDRVRVWWSGGRMEEFTSLAGDRYHLIREGAGVSQEAGPGAAWKR